MASATSARPWPTLATMAPPAASRIRRPSSAISQAPSPPTRRGTDEAMNGQSLRPRAPSMSEPGVKRQAEGDRLLADGGFLAEEFKGGGLAVGVEGVADEAGHRITAPVDAGAQIDRRIIAAG